MPAQLIVILFTLLVSRRFFRLRKSTGAQANKSFLFPSCSQTLTNMISVTLASSPTPVSVLATPSFTLLSESPINFELIPVGDFSPATGYIAFFVFASLALGGTALLGEQRYRCRVRDSQALTRNPLSAVHQKNVLRRRISETLPSFHSL